MREGLDPAIKKESRQVSQRLMANLSAAGDTEVDPQSVYEWALQVTLRRHKEGEFLPAPVDTLNTSMDLTELQDAINASQLDTSALSDAANAMIPNDRVL